jgi:hypothetical protein
MSGKVLVEREFQAVIAAVSTAVGTAIRLSASLVPPSAFRRLCV